MFQSRLFALILAVCPATLAAHELWIEPLSYEIDAGETLQADFKNGENFKGSSLSYFDRSSTRFDLVVEDDVQNLSPRAGDSPALNVAAPLDDGLVVVVHETTPSRITYRDWAKFQKFVAHKDFASAEADHIAAGWPQDRFRERYTRHVKSLIAVGSGKGADREVGLQTEFIALTNPYDPSFSNVMSVMLKYDGTLRPDAQVEVFDRAPDDSVTVTLHRTNADGIADIPVTPGHAYLFDAVVLRPAPEADTQDDNPIVWETLWAALTFAVPQ